VEPARVKTQIVNDAGKVQTFSKKIADETEPLEVMVREQPLAVSTVGLHEPMPFPHTKRFGMNPKEICDNTDGVKRTVRHSCYDTSSIRKCQFLQKVS
jgi:hypothetical protein